MKLIPYEQQYYNRKKPKQKSNKVKQEANKLINQAYPFVQKQNGEIERDSKSINFDVKKLALEMVKIIRIELIAYGAENNELQNMDRTLAFWDKVEEEISKKEVY